MKQIGQEIDNKNYRIVKLALLEIANLIINEMYF